ncbi:MAG: hypothetical protein ACLFPV_14495 [Spirochaetaceae bacterium]
MRKLSAIMLALLLVSGVAMAQTVSFSGTVDWTQVMATDGADQAAASADVKLTAMVDDYNTAVIKYEEEVIGRVTDYDGTDVETTSTYGVDIDEAYFTTDWAGAFGLDQMAPVGIDSTVGYFEYNVANVSGVTGLGYEDVDDWFGDADAGHESWAYQVVVSAMDMVNLQVTVDPGPGPDGTEGDPNTLIGVYGGTEAAFGTIDAEIFYYDADDDAGLDEGYFLIGAAYGGEVVPDMVDLGVGFEFVYDTDAEDTTFDGDDYANDFGYGIGVSGTVMDMATLGLSLVGRSDVYAGGMGIDLNVAPIDLIAFDLGVALVLDPAFEKVSADQETLDMLEASVLLNLGAADFRVGYLYDGTDDTDAANSGNLDTKYKSDQALPGTSAGAIFVRTTLNY